MNIFPREILTALAADEDSQITRLAGNENENYLLQSTDATFVVKRLRGHSAENTELEGVYREYLADCGLPVARYILLGEKSYVLTVNESNYVATRYDSGSMGERNKEVVAEAGMYLAKTHALSGEKLQQRKNWYSANYITESMVIIDNRYSQAKEAFRIAREATIDFWAPEFPKGIIHGDFQYDNIIVDEQPKIVSILDWEEAAIEPLILDVAHTAQQMTYIHGICDRELFATFIDAYQSVRTLSPIEKASFAAALQYTMLVLSVWAHIKASQNQMDDDLFQRVGNYYKKQYDVPEI